MNRRQFGQTMAGFAGGVVPAQARGLTAAHETSYGEQLPDMLLSHLAGKLNAMAAKWDAERAAMRSPQDLERKNHFVRQKFLEMIHGFPPKTLLNSKTVRLLERDGYRVENVMFQSRSGFWVTGVVRSVDYVFTRPDVDGAVPFPGAMNAAEQYLRVLESGRAGTGSFPDRFNVSPVEV